MAHRGPKLSSIQDISAFLAKLIRETYRGNVNSGAAAKIGYLCGQLKACLESGDLEKRVEELEKQLSGKSSPNTEETRKL